METLANLESFIRSAELGGFSAAARRLGLTPAAVSRNVAQLEAGLGVRLFQRSTRRLTLTEAGERFLGAVSGGVESIRAAVAGAAAETSQPAGVLKVSMGPTFGLDYILPMLPDFLARYPAITPDWQFDNRPVDLVAEGFDAAIGGGFELPSGVVARELARVQVVAVATPSLLAGRKMPRLPEELVGLPGIGMRSGQTGRLRSWPMRNRSGEAAHADLAPDLVFNDPEAICRAAVMGLGVAMVAMPHVLAHLESGRLIRLLPDWHADLGPISLYFSSKKLLPAKTRAFVDFIVEQFRRQDLARRFSAG